MNKERFIWTLRECQSRIREEGVDAIEPIQALLFDAVHQISPGLEPPIHIGAEYLDELAPPDPSERWITFYEPPVGDDVERGDMSCPQLRRCLVAHFRIEELISQALKTLARWERWVESPFFDALFDETQSTTTVTGQQRDFEEQPPASEQDPELQQLRDWIEDNLKGGPHSSKTALLEMIDSDNQLSEQRVAEIMKWPRITSSQIDNFRRNNTAKLKGQGWTVISSQVKDERKLKLSKER